MHDFLKTSDLNFDTFYNIENINKNEFILKVYDNDNSLYFINKNSKNSIIIGDDSLLDELVKIVIESNIELHKLSYSKLSKQFLDKYILLMGGRYYPDNDSYYYIEGNIKRLLLAGGCFWCASKPYYEVDGVKKIISGYAGGKEVMPKYEDVKHQKTSHRETILIIYDSKITNFEELIDIFMSSIDPFDDEGQFIDKGNSYTTAIFTSDDEIINYSKKVFNKYELDFNQKVKVKILPNDILYKAEEYHQDFPIFHKKELEEEFEISGRNKKN